MFSVVSVCHSVDRQGFHVTITHDALDFCEAFSVDAHVMPLGELYQYCWFLGYFTIFSCTQEDIRWRLLFQMDFVHFINKQQTSNNTGTIEKS